MNTDIQKAYPPAVNGLHAPKASEPLPTGCNPQPGNPYDANELMKNLIEARNEWLDAVGSFEHAYEEELVDYYTYKMKACEARYTYFIKLAKDVGLTSSAVNIPGAV